jgi:hypothetical protein
MELETKVLALTAEEKVLVLDDLTEILYNCAECKAEARACVNTASSMLYSGATQEQMYSWLRKITEIMFVET